MRQTPRVPGQQHSVEADLSKAEGGARGGSERQGSGVCEPRPVRPWQGRGGVSAGAWTSRDPGSGQRHAPLGPTLATSIQCSTTLALSRAVACRPFRQVVMTQLATLLNWVTVARTVGARCSLPFLSRWDQMEPRQW